jgi:hypothetical protein
VNTTVFVIATPLMVSVWKSVVGANIMGGAVVTAFEDFDVAKVLGAAEDGC